MNFIKLAVYAMLFNLAIGMTVLIHPGLFDDEANRGGLSYDGDYAEGFIEEVNTSIKPTGDLDDQASSDARILDKLAIGVLVKFLTGINKYLYGFVYVLDKLLAPMFGGQIALWWMIKSLLYLFITLSYVKGAIDLWTGKDVDVS